MNVNKTNAQFRKQLETLIARGEQVHFDSWAGTEYEVTVYVLDTHGHYQGRTLPEAMDRAFHARDQIWNSPEEIASREADERVVNSILEGP